MGALRKVYNLSRLAGFDPVRMARTLRGVPRYLSDVRKYKSAANGGNFGFRWSNAKPFLADYFDDAGSAGGHYFYQDIWAARKILQARPSRHIDIGSRIDGFIAHVLVFMPVEVIDIRPLSSTIPGVTFRQADATNLDGILADSVESLSCLHAIEHFGLGRYTDPVDPNACFAAMKAMQRVLGIGGRLYFSTPIGRERVEFNAHRVFNPETILKAFDRLQLVSFGAVDDAGSLIEAADYRQYADSYFACGLFEFTKPERA